MAQRSNCLRKQRLRKHCKNIQINVFIKIDLTEKHLLNCTQIYRRLISLFNKVLNLVEMITSALLEQTRPVCQLLESAIKNDLKLSNFYF